MYQNGDIVEGIITGIQPYGAFVKIDDQHNGLLHISEISDSYIHDIHEYVSMKEKIKVKILDVGTDDHHFKLSLKALHKDAGRKRRSQPHRLLPKQELGFKTLELHLDKWIKEGMDGGNND
ncbi:general stress protein 13 [Breznakia sp. PF5-3]|uniref:CvfD/Ygs/GSP13 family RNA-binding post-transcriptional regulator n=1 Tax=unclassified Breznakia TaxID=2623764 RepID=UPI0024060903|nr:MULTISPECIES: CvfD/Ygs/GSP13 family RNA-binding post-transcriptional regulator [unclassified Breznakia]MDF9823748.1 general stress protein 13 [Breznakia sp. PM6-1]MDF9834546.1 general stress protein 13 [Breznakia sp. PF5-3]MDF9838261.1 general stress protein 13 [Breznakia sp. PFB2-8]MDF9860277.1 general stress protein 13 [Breznakia sp. PH5-24]